MSALGLVYYLSRTERYRIGAGLLTVILFAATYAATVVQKAAPLGVSFLISALLVSSLFLSWRATAFTLAATLGGVLLLRSLNADVTSVYVGTAAFLLAFTGGLILVAAGLQERDRSQIARQTRALVETSQRLTSVMQSAVDAIVSFNDRGYIVGWNKAAETLFGIPELEALGRPMTIIVPERLHGVFEQTVARVRSNRATQRLGLKDEFNALHVGGAEFPAEMALAAWPADGQIYITGFVRDVSERQQAHAALQDANDRLHATVGELQERTRETASLAEMGELLQACTTPAEAYAVIANSVARLFPATTGQLWLIDASRVSLECVAAWGDPPRPDSQRPFAPDQCWALRRGRLHAVDDVHHGLACHHVSAPLPARYMCVPMTAQGDLLGILHIAQTAAAGPASPAISGLEWDEHLAARTAEHIALALANIRLRETLRSQSIRDPLTGLYNRRFMEETLAREISPQRTQRRHALGGDARPGSLQGLQ